MYFSLSMSQDTCSALSPSRIIALFLRVQAAPSRGDTASLPSHPTTLSYSFVANSKYQAHHKEYEQFGMTQGFTELHNVCTSREHLSYQTLHLEYPCSVDGTKPYRLHTRPFYHQLSLVNDKKNEVQFSEHTLYQRNFAHQV